MAGKRRKTGSGLRSKARLGPRKKQPTPQKISGDLVSYCMYSCSVHLSYLSINFYS